MRKNNVKKMIISSLAFALSLSALSIPAEAKQITSLKKAKQTAQKKVPGATVTKVERDTENGQTVYEVTLIKKNKKYSLKYRSSDAKLIEYEWELPNTSYSIQNKKNIKKSKIKTKARKKVTGAKITSTRLTIDDGLSEYKVSMTKGKRRYTLVYNAKNGKLLDYEWKLTNTSSKTGIIGETKAKQIALKKVPGATVIKIEYDKDDGIAVYEVELIKGSYEYDIKIDAKTGAILEYEKDIAD